MLVIAVDELTFTDVTCRQDDNEGSGFQLLCNESVRFTHAYSPSTLSVPALSSLLTGLYPYQHKVRHNGGPGLAAEVETVAEMALKKDYRTSFYSGGAPVFRRSGLHQGFEMFDDNLIPNFPSLFRPFKKSADNFLTWLKQDVAGDAFFTFIYVPDLIFTTNPTTTELGELRNLSFESQLDELDETLYEVFSRLKQAQRWDQTLVILVGLNGHTTSDRYRELSSMNLHGENTQVALFMKPPQPRKRDQAIHWKIDQNVTLVDVGRTLAEFMGVTDLDSDASFPATSLHSVLKSPNTPWPEDRPILLESGWALWRKAGPLRTATISNHVLLINDEKPLLYNTLVDRLEVNPLPLLQESILPTTQRLQSLVRKNGFTPSPPLDSEWLVKLSLPFSRWMRADQEGALLKDLKRLATLQPRSLDLQNWTAQIALNQKSWDTLRTLGQKNNVELWQYVADRHLNVKNPKVTDACFLLLNAKTLETSQLKACSDPLFLEMVDWLRADARGLNKEAQRKRFERSFRYYMLDQLIQRTNIATGLIWDTARDNIYAPSRTELALALPEYTRVRNVVYRAITVEENFD